MEGREAAVDGATGRSLKAFQLNNAEKRIPSGWSKKRTGLRKALC